MLYIMSMNKSERTKDLTNIPKGSCVCSVCNVRKDNFDFQWYKTRFTRDGYRLRVNTNCSPCAKRISKDLREIKKRILKKHPKPDFGQKCDLCQKPVYKQKKDVPDGVDGTWSWQCDHDHDTNEFRGWICKKCNTGLGGIGDNKEVMEKLVNYMFGSIENFVEWRKDNGV